MTNERKGQKRRELAQRLRRRNRNQLLHPTMAALVVSFGLFFMIFGIGSMFHLHYPRWLLHALLLIISVSIGVSGLIILHRGDFIDRYGQIVHGWLAYLPGILFTILGIGATVTVIYNLFIK